MVFGRSGFNLTGRNCCNSQQDFEFSQLNYLLSWAFSRQDKKIKIIGVINGSVTFKVKWKLSEHFKNWTLLNFVFLLILLISLCLMKSNGNVPLLNTLRKIYNKVAICVNELILTPFNPFDIKCKKFNAKNLWKCIFRASRTASFSYFPKVALVYEVFTICADITIFNSSPLQHLKNT